MQHDPPPDDPHRRPPGTSDGTTAATGKLSEGLEWVERTRGHLYELHQLLGHADLTFGDGGPSATRKPTWWPPRSSAGTCSRAAGPSRVVEEFEDTYWELVRQVERQVRQRPVGGRRHVFEAEMKEDRRTNDRPGHAARP